MTLTRSTKPRLDSSHIRFAVREMLTTSSFLLLNKTILEKYGLITGAILSNLIEKDKYWESKQTDEYSGWFFLTNEKQMEMFKVSRGTIQRSKQQLIDDGILQTKRIGIPAREWFSINYTLLLEQMTSDGNRCNSQMSDFRQTSLSKSRHQAYQKSDDYNNNKNRNKKNKNNNNCPGKIDDPDILEKCETLSKRLSQIIQSKKRVSHTSAQLSKWIKDIHALLTKTLSDMPFEEAYQRVENVLHWYRSHIGETYVPVVESGASLREKFLRLETAMERDNDSNSRKGSASRSGKYSSLRKITLEDSDDE